MLTFHRLQTAALETVRRVLEGDDAFRRRVIDAVTEDELGRLAYVWLTRPDGWPEELAMLAAAAQKRDEDNLGERDGGRLRRALAGAEEAAQRHAASAEQARDAARRAQAELAEARASRRVAESAADAARADAAEARVAHAAASQATQAIAAQLDQVRVELDVARTALHEAEAELALERSSPSPTLGEIDPIVRTAVADDEPERGSGAEGRSRTRAVDAAALTERLRAAQATSVTLAESLAAMADDLTVVCPVTEEIPRPPFTQQPHRAVTTRRRGPARRPAPMPPGIWDDSAEAAAHLVRLPGAVVLVDGYNVARTAWPDLTPEEERRRLVAALEELHARTGAEVTVVFDGVQEGPPMPGQGSRTVRVRFSAEGIPADDVVRDLVGRFPLHRPVVVVSSDREVADGARARGANAVSSRQFLSALGR